MSTTSTTNTTSDTLASLPRPQAEPAVQAVEEKIARVREQLLALSADLDTANRALVEAEVREAEAVAAGDKRLDKARALVIERREAWAEKRRQMRVLAASLERLEAERSETLTAAQKRAIPAWSNARAVLVARAEETKAAYRAAVAQVYAYDKAASVAFAADRKVAPVSIRVLRPCLNLTPGEVAGLPPEKARDLALQNFVRYEEPWRQVLADFEREN